MHEGWRWIFDWGERVAPKPYLLILEWTFFLLFSFSLSLPQTGFSKSTITVTSGCTRGEDGAPKPYLLILEWTFFLLFSFSLSLPHAGFSQSTITVTSGCTRGGDGAGPRRPSAVEGLLLGKQRPGAAAYRGRCGLHAAGQGRSQAFFTSSTL